MTFPRNKTIFKFFLKDCVFKTYYFSAEVNFKDGVMFVRMVLSGNSMLNWLKQVA